MAATGPADNEAFRRFLRRVWRDDINPLLRGKRAAQRRKSARVGGKVAAATGLLVDGLFGLKGKPFTRFLTVVGSTVGAILPDAWDWNWLRERAGADEKKVVAEQLRRRAAQLPLQEALALYNLQATASREQRQHAWREFCRRWHPDKAAGERRRGEYHARFVAYQAAYERLRRAYDEGKLPGENLEGRIKNSE